MIKMLLMNNKNIIDMYYGKKTMTLRPLKKNNKGYLKKGSIQEVKNNLYTDYYCKVQITGRKLVDINNLTIDDYHDLGYASKEEYLSEDFNKRNNSRYRIRYKFRVIHWNTDKISELLNE